VAGCFGDSVEHIERAAVSGTVTYDGERLPEGSIQFVPDVDASGKRVRGKAVQALISNGRYSLAADQGPTVCPNKILINASQKTGKFQELDGEKIEIHKQYLPAKYNSESTLRYEVKSGENTANFSLESE
tara:strand:- start:2045 stop:2434 length:390 start_codon:yes stop_codon:yes gene_type:complete